jgi:hypothetical protein
VLNPIQVRTWCFSHGALHMMLPQTVLHTDV